MKYLKNNKAITLIALVITIIILIILAMVTIKLTIGENGIITRAKSMTRVQREAELKDKLELIKAEILIENQGKITKDKYFEKLKESGIIKSVEENVKKINDEEYEIKTIDGIVITIKITENDIIIKKVDGSSYSGSGEGDKKEEEGKEPEIKDTTPPTISKVEIIEKTTDSITVKVEATDSESGLDEDATYKYFINENPIENNSHKFTGLEPNTKYSLKVEVKDKAGNIASEIIEATTEANEEKENMIANVFKVGDWVNYEYKTTEGQIETLKCRVLYDKEYNEKNKTDYGIQIITAKSFDEKVVYGEYNDIVNIFNEANLKYLNEDIANRVRQVGSHPSPKAIDTIELDERGMKKADSNYIKDVTQIRSFIPVGDVGFTCYLASRSYSSSINWNDYGVRCLNYKNEIQHSTIVIKNDKGDIISSLQGTSYGYTRPCFTLKDTCYVVSGTGGEFDPYIIGN